MAFKIEFAPDAWEHLQKFTARERNLILDEIETQLQHEPNIETRNRKTSSRKCDRYLGTED